MHTLKFAKPVPAIVALIVSTIISGAPSEAQQAVAASDSFDYYSCNQQFNQESIRGFYNGTKAAVDVYNSQNTVDVKMEEPKIDLCYIAMGRKGTLLAGVPFIKFYISTAHFQCSVNGDCVGNLAGYDASVAPMKDALQFTANTYRVDDMVNLCYRNGQFSGGRC